MKTADPPDEEILTRIRRGDEAAFCQLVHRYNASLIRIASSYVKSVAAAEEVAQETWMAFLKGLDGFEGRSTLRTWLLRILINRAKDKAKKEGRYVPFPALVDAEASADDPAVDPRFFQGPNGAEPGHWQQAPSRWFDDPETSLLNKEAFTQAQLAIDRLPRAQRAVLVLREIQGCTSGEVCNILEITESNQRVLLHRARSKVRRALDWYFSNRKEREPIQAV